MGSNSVAEWRWCSSPRMGERGQQAVYNPGPIRPHGRFRVEAAHWHWTNLGTVRSPDKPNRLASSAEIL